LTSAGFVTRREEAASRDRRSLSIIIPTRNEADNVEILARRLTVSLTDAGLRGELIFVDDSDDETPARIVSLRSDELPVVLLHRPAGQRQGGLAGAVMEGFSAAQGDILIVMDADLQHPPEAIPSLALSVLSSQRSIAVGSRFVAEAHPDGLSGPVRHLISQSSRVLVRVLFPSIWKLQDPLSGLFAFPESVIRDSALAPKGFKILLEVLVRGRWENIIEVPYGFASRNSGRSKAGWTEGMHFLRQVIRLRFSRRRCQPQIQSSAMPNRESDRVALHDVAFGGRGQRAEASPTGGGLDHIHSSNPPE